VEFKAIYTERSLDEVYHEYENEAILQLKETINRVDEREGLKKTIFEIIPVKFPLST